MALSDKKLSKIKLLIYDKNGNPKTYYSALKEDRKGIYKAVDGLERRIINKLHKNNYQTAIMYKNINAGGTGETLHKWVNGVKEF